MRSVMFIGRAVLFIYCAALLLSFIVKGWAGEDIGGPCRWMLDTISPQLECDDKGLEVMLMIPLFIAYGLPSLTLVYLSSVLPGELSNGDFSFAAPALWLSLATLVLGACAAVYILRSLRWLVRARTPKDNN